MLRQIQAGLLKKSLLVKKGMAVQGSVCIHFERKEVKDIVLNNFDPVDVFQRINFLPGDLAKSNLEALMLRGDIVAV